MGIIVSAVFRNTLELSVITVLVIMVVTTIPIAIDGVTQYFHLRTSNNYLRAMTGIIGGIGSGYGIVWLLYKYIC